MSVKVVKGNVFDGTKTYLPGEIITSLSEEDEASLISGGIAKSLYTEANKVEKSLNNDDLNAKSENNEGTAEANNSTGEASSLGINFNADDYVTSGNK